MGKGRDKRKKDKPAGWGQSKTELKEEKNRQKKNRRLGIDNVDIDLEGEENIDSMLAQFKKQEEKKTGVVIDNDTPPPSVRLGATVVPNPAKSDELIFFGGEFWNGSSTHCYNDLFVYNVEKDTWKQVFSPNGPPPRSGHQAIVYHKSMYIWGGEFTSPSQNQFYHYKDLWKLDTAKMKWEEVKTKNGPLQRSGHRMVLWKKTVVLFGGFYDTLASAETRYFGDTWLLPLDAPKWKRVEQAPNAEEPCPRSGCCMGTHGDNVFLYGGYSSQGKQGMSKGITHSDMWSFNMRSHLWSKVKKSGIPPALRSGMSCTMDKRRMIFFGGVWDYEETDTGDMISTFHNDMYIFNMENQRWFPLQLRGKKEVTEKKPRRRKKDDGQPASPTSEAQEVQVDDLPKGPLGPEGGQAGEAEVEGAGGDQSPPAAGNTPADDAQQDPPPSSPEGGEGQAPAPQTNGAMALEEPGAAPIAPSEGQGEGEPPGSPDQSSGKSPKKEEKVSVIFAPLEPEEEDDEQDLEEAPVDGILTPSPRIQTMMAVSGHHLFLYGGMHEEGKKEIAHDDLYRLHLGQVDTWQLLFNRTEANWEASDDEEDSDDSDSDEESEDESEEESEEESDEEEEEEEGEEGEGAAETGQGGEQEGAAEEGTKPEVQEDKAGVTFSTEGDEVKEFEAEEGDAAEEEEEAPQLVEATTRRTGKGRSKRTRRQKLIEMLEHLSEGVPAPQIGETQREFFARTKEFWTTEAMEMSNEEGKDLRRDGFKLCTQRYAQALPVLVELNEIDAKEKEEKANEKAFIEKKAAQAKKKLEKAKKRKDKKEGKDAKSLKKKKEKIASVDARGRKKPG